MASSMMVFLVDLLLVQDSSAPRADGVVIHRNVRLFMRDVLGKTKEIHRKETVTLRGENVRIEDSMFGEVWIIRPDLKILWILDTVGGTYSELSFDRIQARRKEVLDEIRATKTRIQGTSEEKEIDALLVQYDEFPTPPTVEVRLTERSESFHGRTYPIQEVLVNENIVRMSVAVDPEIDAMGYYRALAFVGGFHPSVAEKVIALKGFPVAGRMRYLFGLDRILSEEKVTGHLRTDVAAGLFELPQGLTRVPLQGFEPAASARAEKPQRFIKSFKEDEIDRQVDPLRGDEKKSEEPK